MKSNRFIKLSLSLCCTLLLHSPLKAETAVITGEITLVEFNRILIADQLYPLKPILKGVDMTKALGRTISSAAFATEVWYENSQMTYETLLAIGHASKADVVLEDGEISQIHILEMMQ